MPRAVSDDLKSSRSTRQLMARKSRIKTENTKLENSDHSENSRINLKTGSEFASLARIKSKKELGLTPTDMMDPQPSTETLLPERMILRSKRCEGYDESDPFIDNSV